MYHRTMRKVFEELPLEARPRIQVYGLSNLNNFNLNCAHHKFNFLMENFFQFVHLYTYSCGQSHNQDHIKLDNSELRTFLL